MKTLVRPMLMAALCLAPLASYAQTDRPRIEYRPSVVVQLAVSDLDRAIRFYEGVLDFTVTERRDDLGFAHVQTNVPGLEIGLSAGGTRSGTGGAIVNISVRDVDAARRLLEARGVVFPKPAQVIPGKVTLLAFTDPDSNQLRLAGPAPTQR